MVRELPTGRLKLRLFRVRAMLGDGSRPGGILRAESFPRNGLRDGRRQLEYPQFAEALSARVLEKSDGLCSDRSRLVFRPTGALNAPPTGAHDAFERYLLVS